MIKIKIIFLGTFPIFGFENTETASRLTVQSSEESL